MQLTQEHLGRRGRGNRELRNSRLPAKKKKNKTWAGNRNQESWFLPSKYANTHIKQNPDRKHAKNARKQKPIYENRNQKIRADKFKNWVKIKKSTIRLIGGGLCGIMNRRSPACQWWSGSHYRRSWRRRAAAEWWLNSQLPITFCQENIFFHLPFLPKEYLGGLIVDH